MTNPDNVGGLLPCPFCGGEAELVGGEQDEFCHWHVQCTVCGAISGESLAPSTPDRDFASESWNLRELCRAAPAGGDEPDVLHPQYRHGFESGMKFEGEHGLMTTNAPKRDSAPAGPGEVGEVADWLDRAAAKWSEGPMAINWADADRMRNAAALLRKLQQGAEGEAWKAAMLHEGVPEKVAESVVRLAMEKGA